MAPVLEESLGLANFSLTLLRAAVGERDNGAIAISPAAVAVTLGMVHKGTKGVTSQQMRKALVGDKSTEPMAVAVSNLHKLTAWPVAEGVTLKTAVRVYVDKHAKLNAEAANSMHRFFDAELPAVDFGNTELLARDMNLWVEKTTDGNVQHAVAPVDIPRDASLILLSGAYFHAEWRLAFNTENTRDAKFYTGSDKTGDGQQVKMMHNTAVYAYKEDESFKLVGLPYRSQQLYMYFVLPKKRHGLQELLRDLTSAKLLEAMNHSHHKSVDVRIPRFRAEWAGDLRAGLGVLGVTDVFDETKADVSEFVDGDGKLHVSKVLHKAMLEIDERGAAPEVQSMMVKPGASTKAPPPKPDDKPDAKAKADDKHGGKADDKHGGKADDKHGGKVDDKAGAKKRAPSKNRTPIFEADEPFLFALVYSTKSAQRQVLFIGRVADV